MEDAIGKRNVKNCKGEHRANDKKFEAYVKQE